MTIELKARLDSHIDKKFNYLGQNVTFSNYKIVGGTNVVIFLDDRPKNLLISEVPDFLNELYEPLEKEVKPSQLTIQKNELLVFEPTRENTQVKQTLLETLEKVKADPGYIPQAEAICNVVNQIVSVQKAEIQMLGLLLKKGK